MAYQTNRSQVGKTQYQVHLCSDAHTQHIKIKRMMGRCLLEYKNAMDNLDDDEQKISINEYFHNNPDKSKQIADEIGDLFEEVECIVFL